uniref:Uncharacterized protein n=1 Tax=Panagrellus redivivus TaxID=6233 RepID=A0A7E4VIA5_PANRE
MTALHCRRRGRRQGSNATAAPTTGKTTHTNVFQDENAEGRKRNRPCSRLLASLAVANSVPWSTADGKDGLMREAEQRRNKKNRK